MTAPGTLFRYVGRQFLFWFFVIAASMAVVIFLIDFLELLRRASGKPDATFAVMLRMELLRLPHLVQEAAPFLVLFAALVTFIRLTRSQELVIARAAGMSVWQFLMPALVAGAVIGILKVGVLNPAAAVMLAQSEAMEGRYLTGQTALLAVSGSGIWLRQVDPAGRQSVIHAPRVDPETMTLDQATVFSFEGNDHFIGRIDAEQARLADGQWEFTNAWMTGPDRPGQFVERYTMTTDLTPATIQESFASPETVSFWQLPNFIRVTEATGFSARSHILRFHALLAEPVLMVAMILIGAVFSLRQTRRGGTMIMITAGALTGIGVFFFTSVVHALGLGNSIPILFAAWMPAGFGLLIGLTLILHQEDG